MSPSSEPVKIDVGDLTQNVLTAVRTALAARDDEAAIDLPRLIIGLIFEPTTETRAKD